MNKLEKDSKKGSLFIVATPIGNLNDISKRALDTLREVDFILAEDTRRTGILLKHFRINTPTSSYRDQNHKRIFPKILALLESNNNLALVSDSGTPLISDPGYKLVSKIREKRPGINIIPIPGPNALISALSVAGLPTDKFIFLGFLPHSKGKKKKILNRYGHLEATLGIYESPYRIITLLKQVLDILGNRNVFIAAELTKKFEKKWYGTIKQILKELRNIRTKGEYVVLISKEVN